MVGSDLVSQVLMICGSLMAVANGLIPSLGAMIYGKLTDELVIRENWNCTLNESVTNLLLRNVVTLEMVQPRGLTAINATKTKSVQVIVNETGIRVKVVGLNGRLQHKSALDENNATSPSVVLNGTALNGTKLMGIIVMGTRVEMVKLKEKAFLNEITKEEETRKAKGEEIIGHFNEGKHEMKSPLKKNGKESHVSFFYFKREADIFSNQLGYASSKKQLMEEGSGNSRKTKRELESYGKKVFIEGKTSKPVVDSQLDFEKHFVGKHEETRKTYKPFSMEAYRREKSESKVKMNSDKTRKKTERNVIDKKSTVQPSNRTNRETNQKFSDDGINVGQVQSIKKLPAAPTPTILPETNNVNYTLRNITRSCRLIRDRIEENMSKYALYYVYAAIGTLVFAYGQMVMWNIASERGVRNLSENLTDSMMDKDPGFYDTKIHEGVVNLQGLTDPQEAISQSDLNALSGGLGGEIAYMIQSLSSMLSGFLVSFVENWKITLVMMAAGPVLVAVQGITDKVQTFVMQQKKELMKRASGLARKSMGSIKAVASYAGEKLEKARYSGKVEAANNLNKLKSLILGVQKGLTTLLAFGFLGLGFWYSSTLLPGGSITPGAVMTIFMAIISGVMQMAGTGEQLEDIGDARTALSSLLGISETDEDPFDKATSQLDTVLGKLDVFNVYFHYPSRPEYQVLKSINFTVEENQTVALLGDKGSGKSALIKLLQRIHDPQTGKVRLDRQDVRFLDRRWYRRQIGIVHKKPEFFNTSVADNIAYGKGEATLKEIVRAAKVAGAHEFILTLPHGYATVLGDDGSPLTSYQKHLIALARALIRNPRILLWEEDLSIMDNFALDALTNYLNQAKLGRTTVISTSHVSVARIADIIVVLHNGEIIEQGSPKELMMSGGAFRYLAALQYFESQTLHQEKLLKTVPVASEVSLIKDGIEELESGLTQTQEETKEQVKGFVSKIRHMIQEKLNEGEAAYKMIRMQLQDLPLLLSGALGAAITGMIAPGLSFLFGEIQKFMNDPLRVAREGPFWASMFVLLGAVVGFGGTIEKFMLTFATEKLKTRLQKLAFETAINKNSVPQNSGIGDVFPGSGGQIPQSTGFDLPFVPGVPTQQFGIPSQTLPTGMDGLPTFQIPGMGDGLPLTPRSGGGLAKSKGNPIAAVPSVGTQPFGIPSQSLPSGMEALASGRIPGMPDGTSSIFPGSIGQFRDEQQSTPMSLPTVPGLPSEQLPYLGGISSESFSSGLQGRLSEQIAGMGDASSVFPRASGLSVPPVPGVPSEQLPSFGAIPPEVLSSGMKAIPSGQIPQTSDAYTPQPMGLNLPSLPVVPTELSPSQIQGNIPARVSPQGINPCGLGLEERLPSNLTQLSPTGVTELALNNSQLHVSGLIPGSLPFAGIPTGVASALGVVPLPGTPMEGYGAFVPGSQISSGEVPHGGLPSTYGVVPAGTQYNANNVPSFADQRGIQDLEGIGLPPNIPNPRPDLLVLPDPQQQADQLMSQVEKDVEAALQNSIGKYLGPKVQETISSVSTLGMALYNGWKMTLVVLAGLPIIGLANRIQQNEADATVEPEGVEALMKTSFKKMETISALGMENKFAKKYKDAIFEKYKQALKKIIASGFAFALGQAMVFFIYAGALRFGCYLISIRDMAAIEVLGVLMTVLFGSYATSSSRAPPHAHEENEDSLNRLFDDESLDVQDHIGDKLDEVEGNLEFKHVELPDPLHNDAPLLSQLSVRVSSGQKLAIVQLDSDKVNPFELLLERFFDPVKGNLLLDGADIRNLDLSWLRSHHAVVSHRCFLSHYSFAENIAYGDKGRLVTQTEIEDAAYSAYAHEFIVDLPKSYETIPDEDQIKLSDSQKLRIVIARAIIRESPIIILDELEEEDQAVTDATDILCRDKTCIILTRRRQTIETADYIILIYHGRILEQGSLNDLLEQRRLFYLLTNLADADEF